MTSSEPEKRLWETESSRALAASAVAALSMTVIIERSQGSSFKRLSHKSVSGVVGALLAVPLIGSIASEKGGASTAPT